VKRAHNGKVAKWESASHSVPHKKCEAATQSHYLNSNKHLRPNYYFGALPKRIVNHENSPRSCVEYWVVDHKIELEPTSGWADCTIVDRSCNAPSYIMITPFTMIFGEW
jgi:hypothetical protein